MRAWVAILLTFTLSAGGYAEPAPCVRYLAEAPSPAERAELVAKTYLQLLEALGASLSAEEIGRLAEGDPFVTFDQPFVPAPLRRPLRQLRELVERKDWRDAVTREVLRAALRDHAFAKRGAEERVERAVAQAYPIHDVTFPHRWEGAIHPHESWILVSVRPSSRDTELEPLILYDVDRRTHEAIPGASAPLVGLTFSRDGTELFAATAYEIWRVPFRDRAPHWAEAIRIGEPRSDRAGTHFRIEQSPVEHRLYVSASFVGHPEYLVDLATNRRTAIDMSALDKAGIHMLSWGTIPGSADLYVTASGTDSLRMFRLEIGSDGVARLGDGGRERELEDEPRRFLNGGKSMLVQTDKWVDIHTQGQNRQMYVDRSLMSDATIRSAAVNAEETRLAVLIREADESQHVEWYAVQGGKLLGRTPLPRRTGFQQVRFLPNGHLLISGSERTTATIAELPY